MKWRGPDEPAPPGAADATGQGGAGDRMALVVVGFDDMVRAEQAAGAADFWRRANRRLPIGPITVVGRTLSGSVAVTTHGVVRPRPGARRGFMVGLLLLGLPAAGVGGFIGWLFATLGTSLLNLTGVISDQLATVLTLGAVFTAAVIAAFLVGALGGLVGAGIGALVGVIHSRANDFSGSQVGVLADGVMAGDAIVAVKAGVSTVPLVTDELLRMGGIPRPTPALSRPVDGIGDERSGEGRATGGTDAAAR